MNVLYRGPVLGAALLSSLTACTGTQPGFDVAAGGVEACAAPLSWPHLLGSLHEHSGYSDGTLGTTPGDYFAAGAAQGLDFMGGSDHSDNARLPITADADCVSADVLQCIQLPPEGLLKWEATADLAEAASTDTFTAFRGFEWTSDRFGHINVFFSTYDLNAKTSTGYLLSMADFWFWFTAPLALLGGEDGVAVFNHPGREDALHTACESLGPLAGSCGSVYNGDPAYAWNDLEYRAEAAPRIVGIEMYGKASDYYDGENGAPAGGWYAHALDQGWHLAPVGAEDEHGVQWGQPQRAKTVFIAESHAREALKEAMLARRFYALAHAYGDVRVRFHAGDDAGEWPMGSRLTRLEGAQLKLSVAVEGVDTPRIELIGPTGAVLHSVDASRMDHGLLVDTPEEGWVFARVRDLGDADADGKDNEVVAVTAPIWYRSGESASRCGAGAFAAASLVPE